ncbi:MAG: hypothetical protein LBV39_01340 [Bacteroidales bacterium]|jgi:hypothetical protein|nr:hypothetical protein [Bacteroidales bacterium]
MNVSQITFGKFWVVLMVCLAAEFHAAAQNSTSSPLSIFSIGEIESRDFGATSGWGNVGIGLKSKNFLNRRNPAGLSGIDTLKFIFDFSGSAKFSELRTASATQKVTNFNFKNLAVGFRVSKRWTSSVGLSPFSNVGYNVSKVQLVEGSNDVNFNTTYTGDGGINKFYWSNSVEVLKGLTLGATASYYFGTMTHLEAAPSIAINETMTANKINFDFGAQYSYRLKQHTLLTVGGIYGYQSDFNMYRHRTIINQKVGIIAKDEKIPDQKMQLPEFYGAGISIWNNKHDAEWSVAFDYFQQNWSVNKEKMHGLRFADSHVYNAGFQIIPNTKRPATYLHIMSYQVGACYNESYLTINGYQLKDYSVSVGVGLPFMMGLSRVNVSVILGQSGTGQRGGITENYALLSINLSLLEIWFAKDKYK